MERILSQEEIAELLSAVDQGEIAPEPETLKLDSSAEVSRLDLVRSHASGQLRLNNLDLILDSFARNYAITLTNKLQQPLTIKRANIESAECEPFLQNLPAASAIGVFKFEPLRGGAMLVFDPNLSFGVVEILLGGSIDNQLNKPDRPLTAIELNVLRGSFADASPDLAKAFGDLPGVNISIFELQNNPRLVSLIPAEAMTVVASLDVDVNGRKGMMQLVIPTAVLDPMREQFQASRNQQQAGDDSWRGLLRREVATIPLEISAELGQISLEMRDFINFQVGDIIDLPWKPTDNLTVHVENRPKYQGQAGVRNGNKAIRISGIYQEGAQNGN